MNRALSLDCMPMSQCGLVACGSFTLINIENYINDRGIVLQDIAFSVSNVHLTDDNFISC